MRWKMLMVNTDETRRLLQLLRIFSSRYKFLSDSFKVPCGSRRLKAFEALPDEKRQEQL